MRFLFLVGILVASNSIWVGCASVLSNGHETRIKSTREPSSDEEIRSVCQEVIEERKVDQELKRLDDALKDVIVLFQINCLLYRFETILSLSVSSTLKP